jgi:SAM-dependent methyltransferase
MIIYIISLSPVNIYICIYIYIYMNLRRREIINYKEFTKENNLFKFHKDILKNKKFKIDNNFDINKIWTSENVEMRKNFLNLIAKYEDFNKCYDNVKDNLDENTKRNKEWFERYHNLFYSIKNKGYKVELVKSKSEYPACVVFLDNTIYRLDGTHRCSVMKHLGFEVITVKVYHFKDIINDLPELNNCFKDYIIKNNPGYQNDEHKLVRKYGELIEKSKKYINKKNVADIGCNAGYFTELLGQAKCNHVTGVDISENNLQLCKLSNKNKSKVNFFLGCISEYDNINNFDVFFFLRSIYHVGNTIEDIINRLDSGKIFIIECNRSHARKFKNPEIIYNGNEKDWSYKRLALGHNVKAFLENRGFEILETFTNYDNCVVAKKK